MMGSCLCLDTYRAGDLQGAANVNVVRCSRLAGLIRGASDASPASSCALTSGLRFHASIPLYARGRRLGIMNVASPDWRELSRADLRLLHTVGDLLAIAVERALLYARSIELGAAEERNRIAREIHDTLAQGLAGITLQLETAEVLLESGAEAARVRAAVGRALHQARASLEEARRSVLDLRAAPLEGRTLAQALEQLVGDWSALTGIDARVDIRATAALPARIETGLYRIAREALANVARHAGASHVRVTFSHEDATASLTVEDDGAGFDPADVPRERFGLTGMTERARLLGGRLRVESGPATGTRVIAEVPA
jgi:two-component system NarL family sensor kinase